MKRVPSNEDFLESMISAIVTNIKGDNDVGIIEFAEDILFNAEGYQLFPTQKAILKAIYNEPLNDIEREILKDWFGEERTTWVEGRFYLNMILEAGRRACHSNDSLIPTTKGTITFEKLLEYIQRKEKIGLITYDQQTSKQYITYDIDANDNGIKPVIKITTRTGRTEKTTYEHPYLVWKKENSKPQWIPISELKIGDRIAVSRSLPVWGGTSIGIDRAKLLGFLSGDGGVSQTSINFTNTNLKIIEDIKEILSLEFPSCEIIKTKDKYGWRIISKKKEGFPRYNEVAQWLTAIGERKLAKNKNIPDCIKQAPKAEVAAYLNRLFACDGYVSIDKARFQHSNSKVEIAICLASERFILDIQTELLKFGIHSYINYKPSRYEKEGEVFDSWCLNITTRESIVIFTQEIGIFQKEDKLLQAFTKVQNKQEAKSPLYSMPLGVWNYIKDIQKEKSLKNSDVVNEYGKKTNARLRIKSNPCRRKVYEYSNNIDCHWLKDLSSSEILWDEVSNLEYLQAEPTVALEVYGTRVIGNSIISHNSKSVMASIIALYEFYSLITQANPARKYGLLPSSPIAILVIGQGQAQVKETIFAAIKGFAENSYYFKALAENGVIEILSEEIRCSSKNIAIYAKHTNSKALVGYSIKCLVLDEVSRFETSSETGENPGLLIWKNVSRGAAAFGRDAKKIAISSAWEKGDPMEVLYEEAQKDVQSLAFRLTTFHLNINLKKGITPIIVSDYATDPLTARLEYEGIRFNKHGSFLTLDILKEACKGFSCLDAIPKELDISINGDLRHYIGIDILRLEQSTPELVSFIHVDPALKKDSAALAIASSILLPNQTWGIAIDGLLKWEPGIDEKGLKRVVSFIDLEEKIEYLATHRRVKGVSFDQYNSASFIQQLHMKGINTKEMSCSRDNQLVYYTLFRDLLNHNLIIFPKDNLWIGEAITELSELIIKPNKQIVHPYAGKDLADAIVGAVFNCFQYQVDTGLRTGLASGISKVGSTALATLTPTTRNKLKIGNSISKLKIYNRK